jgi:uncharacterized protein
MSIGFRLLTLVMIGGAAVLWPPQGRAAPAGSADAMAIMQRNHAATWLDDSQAQTLFRLIGSNGKLREQQAITMARRNATGGMTRLARFVAPADVKGTAVLTVEHPGSDDDIWVYLPALGNVRRLQASNKSEAYMGTDLSYGDVIGHAPDAWTHRLAGRQVQSGTDCWVVESQPATPAIATASGYGKRINWIRTDNDVMVRAELYDVAGKLVKRIAQSQITQVSLAPARWQAMLINVENARTGHRTEIIISGFEANRGLKPTLFLPRALERSQ